jgi:two-component system chemotaxis response regulator CheB
MIRVLIVEDSPTARTLLKSLLETDPEIQVVGSAANGKEAVQQALRLKPDLITMDIRMPVMDGFEATRCIMRERPTPIVVVSASVEAPDLAITFNAIKAGALEVIEKPKGIDAVEFQSLRDHLVTTVKLMAEVKVIRRRPSRPVVTPPPSPNLKQPRAVIAIGASTGGPVALNTLFKSLPREFPLPIVVVQHMAGGFMEGFVRWLQLESNLPLKIMSNHLRIRPGEVYFAPEDQHSVFVNRDLLGLTQDPVVSHVRPSATVLFKSVARVYGAEAVGILLTGMGEDGAAGLEAMRQRGALTLAQDEGTSVVYGMPKAAVELGAVDQVLPIDRIAPTLVELAGVSA